MKGRKEKECEGGSLRGKMVKGASDAKRNKGDERKGVKERGSKGGEKWVKWELRGEKGVKGEFEGKKRSEKGGRG